MDQSAFTAHNEELKAFNDLAESFAKKELMGYVHDYEYPYAHDVTETIQTAIKAGLFGINLPLDYGGVGLSVSAIAGIVHKISIIDAGMAGVLFTHAAALEVIAAAAESDTENCRSIYEPAAGTEGVPLAFQTYASPDEIDLPEVTGKGRHLLTGRLPLVVLGGTARYAVVTGTRQKGNGFSYYLIDLSAEGVTRSDPVLTLGFQACQAVDITLKDVPGLLIGGQGKGEVYFEKMQLRMSLAAAAISLGIMEGSFKEAFDYAEQRWQGGRNIVEWSAVRMKLAEMGIAIDVGRNCLAGICSEYDSALKDRSASAMAAAIHISELACSLASEGVQVLGGNGYMKDYGQEKRMRDARQAQSLLGMIGLKKMNYIDRIIEEARI